MRIRLKQITKFLALFLLLFSFLQVAIPSLVNAETFEDVPGWPALEDIRSSAYAIYNATTDEFLLEKNMHQPLWNASTTKVLTALTAAQHEDFDLDAMLLVSDAATYFGDPASARLKLKPGELISTRDVLGGLMVLSANDCAYVLAENYGGFYGHTSDLPQEEWGNFAEGSSQKSRQAFVAEMNRVAKGLGAENTNFDNPCGFDGETHNTTAHDLALISNAFLENEDLAPFSSLAHYMPEPTNMHPYAGWSLLTNTNGLVVYGTNFFQSQYIARYNGVKTGTTPRAGSCLIGGGITHDGEQIIAVLLGGSVPRSDNSYVSLAIPVRTLLEYGAYLSGSPSMPYSDAPLPTFPPLLDTSVTEPAEDPDNGETEVPGDDDPEQSVPEETQPQESDPVIDENPGVTQGENPENLPETGELTRREKLVIALSGLIVLCVIAILIGNQMYNRKYR